MLVENVYHTTLSLSVLARVLLLFTLAVGTDDKRSVDQPILYCNRKDMLK